MGNVKSLANTLTGTPSATPAQDNTPPLIAVPITNPYIADYPVTTNQDSQGEQTKQIMYIGLGILFIYAIVK